MNKAKQLLVQASQKLELPADIVAGVPRIDVIGTDTCSVEPHRGLLEYSGERISVSTSIGAVTLLGDGLEIKQMNTERITIAGKLHRLELPGGLRE